MKYKVQSYLNMYNNIDTLDIYGDYPQSIACLLSLSEADTARFATTAELIHDNQKSSMKLKPNTRYLIATLLTIGFEHPEEKVDGLLSVYQKMLDQKFQPGFFTTLAASVILMSASDKDHEHVLLTMKKVYEHMESIHPFLTTPYSYPLAALLTLQADDPIEDSKELYRLLHLNGFKKGRDLQLLTHILLLHHNNEDMKQIAKRGVYVLHQFENFNRRAKKEVYPLLGLLAFIPPSELDMEAITLTYERLDDNKRPTYNNLLVAVSLSVSDYTDLQILAPVILTTLEKHLQDREAFNPFHPASFIPGLLS